MKKILWTFLLTFAFVLSLLAQQGNMLPLAIQYEKEGETDKAISIYEKLFYDEGKDELVYNSYISCLLKQKQYSDARKAVKRMIKKFPNNLSYIIDQGKIFKEEGKAKNATKLYESLVEKLSPDISQIVVLAKAFEAAKEFDFGIATLLKGRKLLKNDDLFINDLADLYKEKNDKNALVTELVELLKKQEGELEYVKTKLGTALKTPEDYNLLRIATLKGLQNFPNNIRLSELLVWGMIQNYDFEQALIQTIALDRRLSENGYRLLGLGAILLTNKRYDEAIKAYTYVLSKEGNPFYVKAKMGLLNARGQKINDGVATLEDLKNLENDYLQLLNETSIRDNNVDMVRKLAALQAYKLDKIDAAIAWLEKALTIPNISERNLAETKLELGDMYILANNMWEATLLYSQVEKMLKHDPMGQEAMFRNAKLAFYNGDFAWAKSQLDVLKGATSQLISNDAMYLSALIAENDTQDSVGNRPLALFARAELNIFTTRYTQALQCLDSLATDYGQSALADDELYARAKILTLQKKYDESRKKLLIIIDKYYTETLADDALFLLAKTEEENLNDSESAKQHYEKLIADFPASVHVVEARKRYRILRGDVVPANEL